MKSENQSLMKPPAPSWVAATGSRQRQPRRVKPSEKSGYASKVQREELSFSQPKLIPFLHEVAALLAAQVRLELSHPPSTQLH